MQRDSQKAREQEAAVPRVIVGHLAALLAAILHSRFRCQKPGSCHAHLITLVAVGVDVIGRHSRCCAGLQPDKGLRYHCSSRACAPSASGRG